METAKLLLLPGDGIGPEVMAETARVIAWFAEIDAPPLMSTGRR